MTAALVIASVLIILAITGLYVVSRLMRPDPGHHARRPAAPVPAVKRRPAKPFADPADVTDPDGDRFVAQVTRDLPPELADTASWRAPDLELMERVHAGLAKIPAGDGPATVTVATRAAAAPFPVPDAVDATLTQLHAVCTWGKTPAQLADELAAEHLAVTQ